MPTMESFVDEKSWGSVANLSRDELILPDPEPAEVKHLIISVDDHLVEPGDMFVDRVPARLRDRAPRVVEEEDGREYWLIEGGLEINVGGNAAAGRSPKAPIGGESVRFDEMRLGAWDVDERVRDMDLNGIYASLSFPSTVFGFCGQRFMRMRDPKLGFACMRAYNDWVIDAWTAPHPDRIIPSQITWLHDAEIAADEIRRNAERGAKAVAFSENPQKLGLPSIHSGHWEPFFRACEETETVINLHVGSSSEVSFPSSDAPLDVMSALFSVNSILAAADWLYSGVALRYPNIKIAFSEGGIGWVPMLLDRLDYLAMFPRTSTWTASISQSELFQRNFWFTTFWDPSTFRVRDRVGVDRIMVESDYPHVDSTWPNTQKFIADQLVDVPADEARKITCQNASELYRHPLPS